MTGPSPTLLAVAAGRGLFRRRIDRIAASLSHHILAVHDSGEAVGPDGRRFVMIRPAKGAGDSA